ncbi:MAG: hypothetical protein H7301_03830 [Cryobacterium sp.]|nr:hypothetical protein [Oligoflexia bacterium]
MSQPESNDDEGMGGPFFAKLEFMISPRLSAKAFAPFLYFNLAFIVALTSTTQARAYSSRETPLSSCVHEICDSQAIPEGAHAFITREKTNHPDLKRFFSRYRDRIESFRIAHLKQFRESMKSLSLDEENHKVVVSFTDKELVRVFTVMNPWNVDRVLNGTSYELNASPTLMLGPDFDAFLKRFFATAIKSKIYRAHLRQSVLNEPFQPNNPEINANKTWVESVRLGLESRLTALPAEVANSIRQRLKRYSNLAMGFPADWRDRAMLEVLGLADLEISTQEGGFSLSSVDRELLQTAVLQQLRLAVQSKNATLSALASVHSRSAWESTCSAAYNRSLHYAVTEQELKTASAAKERAMRLATAAMIDAFGFQTAGELQKYVDMLRVDFPITLETFGAMIETYLKNGISHSATPLDFIGNYFVVRDFGEKPREDNELSMICNDFIYSPIGDAADRGRITLSSYSTKYPKIGMAIILHETGHAISLAFQEAKKAGKDISSFLNLRSCISETYSASAPPASLTSAIYFKGDYHWTEEDWGDAFSGFAMEKNGLNSGCILSEGETDPGRTTNRTDQDSHSPVYYRTLLIYSQMGKPFSPACESAVRSYAPKMPRRSCFH